MVRGPMHSPFTWTLTDDGSPTLIDLTTPHAEAMHSRAGAFTESLKIYDRATTHVMGENWPGHYLSVGLGLGYNEIILAAHVLGEDRRHVLSLTSLETSDYLIQQIQNWVTGQNLETRWFDAHETISRLAEDHFGLPAGSVRTFLRGLLEQRIWEIGGALTRDTPFKHRASAIFYDAYSSKTCPDLWDEALLAHILTKGAAEKCVLTTYALTGTLKRALAVAGFARLDTPGFSGKRHSTFAVRRSYSNSMER